MHGDQLTVKDTMTLHMERSWWKYDGAKATAIRERFWESPTVYYARLNRLLDEPAALAYDPMLVRRLRRLREVRQAARGARRVGWAM